MIEIGSEFWLEDNNNLDKSKDFDDLINFGGDRKLLFSGRSAIDYVLEDIIKTIKTVYMPSYCCKSMLQPFVDRNIRIEFYEVFYDGDGLNYSIDYEKEVDIFFANSYFGFDVSNMDRIIKKFRGRDVIVIEDITHRFLCEQNCCRYANYFIASLRKWFSIPSGGVAIKGAGEFTNNKLLPPPDELVEKKVLAMSKKANFIYNQYTIHKTNKTAKSDFLKLYSDFNFALNNNYKNIEIDLVSKEILKKINIEDIKKKRVKNTIFIYQNFKKTNYIKLLFSKFNSDTDCPLFVPIIVKPELRGALKNYFITNNIFCPIHWPNPVDNNYFNKETKILYNTELSLVCDHRYGLNDIKRIITTLGGFTDKL
ncbi:hypothetical protein K8O68_01955 [Salipaludibacillus sp. CUR1]|uniref:hypothetical protein n=1 Tax=Salipaludibacillus sp. CUR1 TaxID=2820003 RepID=UPI001E654B19|nr:hypothetical protein [Salipaludibacillus sp. CUR1]MCE7791181.1 hypothetical protein [Salipaludibacillus sp. CUR1]